MQVKTSLISAALLGLLAAPAMAQSSATVYGKLDLGVGQAIGSQNKTLLDAGGSRLGFRGQEDLGDGLSAVFQIEHRFDPATGTAWAQGASKSAQGRFWNGRSSVGLKNAWGSVQLGRLYTPAYDLVQNQIDPFGGDTVAALRDAGMRPDGLYATRVSYAVRADASVGGLSAGALVGDSNANGKTRRPLALGLGYALGALYLGAGFEQTGDEAADTASVWNLGARYKTPLATLSAGFGKGQDKAGTASQSWLLGAAVPVGRGEVKLGYARQSKDGSGTTVAKLGLGYHHKLSARTKLYADVGHDAEQATRKNGWDLGVQHNF